MEEKIGTVSTSAEEWALSIVGPFLILTGTIGNAIILFTYSREQMRHTAAAVFLGGLAIGDTLCLYTGLLRHSMYGILGRDIAADTIYHCKLLPFFQYTFQYLSSWILILFTVERCLLLWHPDLILHTLTSSFLGVCVLLTASVAINSFYLFQFNLVPFSGNSTPSAIVSLLGSSTSPVIDSSKTLCIAESLDFLVSFSRIWPWWNLIADCTAPFTILTVSNILIIVGVSKHKSMINEYEDTNDEEQVEVVQTARRKISQVHLLHGSAHAPLLLIIGVNVLHLFITAPRDIYFLLYFRYRQYLEEMSLAKIDALRHCLAMIGYTNNAINFPLYCVTRKDFRHELIRICTFFHQHLWLRSSRIGIINVRTV